MATKRGNIRRSSLRSDRVKSVPINKRLGIKKSPLKKTSPLKPAILRKESPLKPTINTNDARFKIIAKNRTKMHDARDKLSQMAKTKDAREKLTKMREARSGNGNSTLNSSFTRPVGKNITMKKDRHGKISLTTKKAAIRSTASNIPSMDVSLGLAVQRQLGLIGALPTNGRTVQRKHELEQRQKSRSTLRASKSRKSGNNYHDDDASMEEDYMAVEPPVIRRTIHNNIVPELPPLPDFSYHHQAMEPGTYGSHGWENNGLRTSGRGMIDMESRRRESRPEYVTYSVLNEARTRPNMTTARNMHAYIDLDAVDEPLPISKTPLNAGIRARLDTVSVQSHQSHGIFANSKSKALVSPGHRIVVSNLHAAVTQEDITELFADIGDLMIARLVRPGTAEVIYKNLVDANKAVEVYHNRQLDGQPMKCMLVNKRPTNNPTAPALTKSITTSPITGMTSSVISTSRSADGTKKLPTTTSSKDKLVPDLSTIHKVLFNRSFFNTIKKKPGFYSNN